MACCADTWHSSSTTRTYPSAPQRPAPVPATCCAAVPHAPAPATTACTCTCCATAAPTCLCPLHAARRITHPPLYPRARPPSCRVPHCAHPTLRRRIHPLPNRLPAKRIAPAARRPASRPHPRTRTRACLAPTTAPGAPASARARAPRHTPPYPAACHLPPRVAPAPAPAPAPRARPAAHAARARPLPRLLHTRNRTRRACPRPRLHPHRAAPAPTPAPAAVSSRPPPRIVPASAAPPAPALRTRPLPPAAQLPAARTRRPASRPHPHPRVPAALHHEVRALSAAHVRAKSVPCPLSAPCPPHVAVRALSAACVRPVVHRPLSATPHAARVRAHPSAVRATRRPLSATPPAARVRARPSAVRRVRVAHCPPRPPPRTCAPVRTLSTAPSARRVGVPYVGTTVAARVGMGALSAACAARRPFSATPPAAHVGAHVGAHVAAQSAAHVGISVAARMGPRARCSSRTWARRRVHCASRPPCAWAWGSLSVACMRPVARCQPQPPPATLSAAHVGTSVAARVSSLSATPVAAPSVAPHVRRVREHGRAVRWVRACAVHVGTLSAGELSAMRVGPCHACCPRPVRVLSAARVGTLSGLRTLARPPTYQPPVFWTISVTRGPAKPCREEEPCRVVFSRCFSVVCLRFFVVFATATATATVTTPSPLASGAFISHLPMLSEEEEQIIGDLCSDALVAAWNEDSAVEDVQHHLRQLWKTALRYGFGHGQKEGRLLGRKEVETTDAKELELERVWGFDVGWKLCSELHQSCASKASLVLPSPSSPRSLSVASTQTDTTAVAIVTPVPAAAAAPTPFDWAEDAAGLPTLPLQAESPPSTPRDFSALTTGSPKPFASLQRRRRRSPRPVTSSSLQNQSPQKFSVRRPQKKSAIHAAPRRTPPSYSHPPSSIPFRAPASFPLSDRPAPQFPLDWDQDPRLRDLGQALIALGWARL
ncbi:hypothetical protein GGX14DRAFT_656686 [Mycena pura]|uniref:Uncharacterized protein n=1 Tax=Mycena pura TaxID=153505 RepID=A0AAD6V3M5_9AGAR|nr:hypothetical protein GGX14DRAFT_656686 [Mycena pura]